MTIDYVQKYNDDNNCMKCGVELMFDGQATYNMPIGFGSHEGSTKLFVDKVQYKGWYSKCMKCQKVNLAYQSKKLISKSLGI